MFKAINNLFSKKYDLLAIGLFTGASVALLLSELFNWFLNGLVSRVLSENSAWFALLSFFLMFLKLFCIAFVLFDIDWLYNKFVRKHFKQTVSSVTRKEIAIQQEVEQPVALEDLSVSKAQSKNQSKSQLKARLKTQLKKDQELQQQSQNIEVKVGSKLGGLNDTQANPKGKFIVEYLKGHDDELPSELTSELDFTGERVNPLQLEDSLSSQVDKVESRQFAIKHQKQEQLRAELAKLMKDDDVSVLNAGDLDLIAILRQDMQDSDSLEALTKLQKKSNLYKTSTGNTELSPQKVRSVLARQ